MLKKLKREKQNMEEQLASLEETPNVVSLHPTSVADYLATIKNLADARACEDAEGAMQPVRRLIDKVAVTPHGETMTISVEGRLNILTRGNKYPTIILEELMVAEVRYCQSPHSGKLQFQLEIFSKMAMAWRKRHASP